MSVRSARSSVTRDGTTAATYERVDRSPPNRGLAYLHP